MYPEQHLEISCGCRCMQEQLAELQPFLALLQQRPAQPTALPEDASSLQHLHSSPPPVEAVPEQPLPGCQPNFGRQPSLPAVPEQQQQPDLDSRFGLSSAVSMRRAAQHASACVSPIRSPLQQAAVQDSMSGWPSSLLQDLSALLPRFPGAEGPGTADAEVSGLATQLGGPQAQQSTCVPQAEADQVQTLPSSAGRWPHSAGMHVVEVTNHTCIGATAAAQLHMQD